MTLRPHPLFAMIAVTLAGAALYFYVPARYVVSTNDAYVQSDPIAVVSKVPGYVHDLHVGDNARVRAGDLLAEIDPRDYQVAVASARAELDQAIANATTVSKQEHEQGGVVEVAAAAIAGDDADLAFAEHQLARNKRLLRGGVGTEEQVDQSAADVTHRRSILTRDLAALSTAKLHVDVLKSQSGAAAAAVEKAQAALAKAELDLSYTRIVASADGFVANRSVTPGTYLQAGQQILSTIPSQTYVIANFKETQLDRIRPGQRVKIRLDAAPNRLFDAHVDSVQRGTGSSFALLPPENSSGNFVKVVQRVPVKIVFDRPTSNTAAQTTGLSAEPRVIFREPPRWMSSWILE